MADDNPQAETADVGSPPPSDLPPLFAGASSPTFSVNPSAPSALARLTLTDKLLLAQVVHHLAESPPNWANVSNLVLSHPLIKNPARVKAASDANLSLARIFGTRECERAWTALMRQHNLVVAEDEPVADTKQRPKEAKGAQPRVDRKSQLALAQILYAERMEELRDSIKKKEEEFRSLIQRIDQIKAGQLDEQLQGELDQEVRQVKQPTPVKNGHARRLSKAAQQQPQQEEGDQMDVEDVLGGRGDDGKNTEPPASTQDTQAGGGDDGDDEDTDADADTTQDTRRSKRKRGDTEAGDEEGADANDTDSKRSRPRPAAVTRRSRRGPAREEEGDEDEAAADRVDYEDSTAQAPADEDEADDDPTPSKPKSSTTAPRRSLRARGSTQSRETSVRGDLDHDEEGDATTDADTSIATLKDTPTRRQSKRDLSRRASSSARHNSVESSSTREQREKERERRRKANEKVLLQIWTEVSSHTHGNLFQNVVKESDAPDYHNLIRHPTSLKTIKTQIKEGEIQTMTQLRRAFNHLFANAVMYNRPTSEVGRMAREMRDATEAILDRFEETRNLANSRR